MSIDDANKMKGLKKSAHPKKQINMEAFFGCFCLFFLAIFLP